VEKRSLFVEVEKPLHMGREKTEAKMTVTMKKSHLVVVAKIISMATADDRAQ